MVFHSSVAAIASQLHWSQNQLKMHAMIPVPFDDEEEAEVCSEDTAAAGLTTLCFHFSIIHAAIT